ncbi:DUF4334 domain-containing protein [Nonomuraea antimicrobica]|uniref:DUF4334 domain-containing protein n=1 Tax=Nonomuraea antimicrobica TaxID=561173 RepID=A0ABP7C3S1_9ACTN
MSTEQQDRRLILDGLRARPDGAAALRYYDSLDPVAVEELFGVWRGSEVRSDHPLDGLLKTFGWYGKRFDGPDDVHPLVFTRGDGRPVAVSPSFLPVNLLLDRPRLARLPVAALLFRLALPLTRTTRPQARLRMTEYRGVVTATMCYDALPVHDAFRKVDDDLVMGAMELRGSPRPFLFLLSRVRGTG